MKQVDLDDRADCYSILQLPALLARGIVLSDGRVRALAGVIELLLRGRDLSEELVLWISFLG